jgi:hypothetical protein
MMPAIIQKYMHQKDGRRGQAMLLAVLTIGATMLGATTIAGLLMLYQIRQTNDFEHSAQAVFAADAGTEWALYNYYVTSTAPLSFLNGASAAVTCYDASAAVSSCATSTAVEAISKGSSGNTKRAFLITFTGTGGTLP